MRGRGWTPNVPILSVHWKIFGTVGATDVPTFIASEFGAPFATG